MLFRLAKTVSKQDTSIISGTPRGRTGKIGFKPWSISKRKSDIVSV
jgi:hypothetical protein